MSTSALLQAEVDETGGVTPTNRSRSSTFLPIPSAKRIRTFPVVSLLCFLGAFLYISHLIGNTEFYAEWFTTTPPAHPIPALLAKAQQQHLDARRNRSQSLKEATAAYTTKHGRLPPNGFDLWFYVSQQTKVCNLDSFPQLYESIKPYWGISPREVRSRIDAIAGVNMVGRVRVRAGKVVDYATMMEEERGIDTAARKAVQQMLEMVEQRFRIRLPDVDIMVNGLDEPRVMIPYAVRTELERFADRGKVRHEKIETPIFSELQAGETPFSLLRATCPPSSPVGRASLSSSPGQHPITSSSRFNPFTTSLGSFLSSPSLETSTFCDQPELQDLHATLINPLSFNWGNGLWPVFSCSKLAGFGDILVPAWFYWFEGVKYEEAADFEWKQKSDQMFWRGANTGGKSIGLNWIGWLRSRVVSKLNRPLEWAHLESFLLADENDVILSTTLPSHNINNLLTDVAFSSPDVHGTAASLESQRNEPSFRFTGVVPFRENYQAKIILDLDGTAYSGRFVALMKSRSAIFKSKLYLETFDSSLIPWFHYIPVSVRFTEIYNLLSYFFSARNIVKEIVSTGKIPKSFSTKMLQAAVKGVPHEAELKRIAEQGTNWANECARKEDMVSYMHLLALEWSRIASDDRESNGFSLPKEE